MGEFALAPPFLTYTTGVTLWSDDLRCDVRYVGTPAHTTNDSIVHLPDRSVLFAGDLLFKGGTPFVLMGSLTGTIDVLENVVRPLGAGPSSAATAPSAGPRSSTRCSPTSVSSRTSRAGRRPPDSPPGGGEESDLGSFAGLLDAERIVGNLHRAYAELDGAEAGERIDNAAAYRDMIAYNGGRPLTSHA